MCEAPRAPFSSYAGVTPTARTLTSRAGLQDRGYVVKQGKALQATSRGRVLSAFLQHYFTQYVDYDFTSDMEAQLDEVAGQMQMRMCSQ